MQKLIEPPETSLILARRRPRNGGFPEPLPGEPVRVVSAIHRECGHETRVSLPRTVTADVVERVVCGACGVRFARLDPPVETEPPAATSEAPPEAAEAPPPPAPAAPPAPADLRELIALIESADPFAPDAAAATEVDAAPARTGRRAPRSIRFRAPSLPRPSVRLDPRLLRLDPRLLRLAAVPVAAIAVLAGLQLFQGGSGPAPVTAVNTAAETPTPPSQARFLKRPNYSLALPTGWRTQRPESGASLSAVDPSGQGDVTLWVERNPSLSFKGFEKRSLDHLKTLAENARVYRRLAAPTGGGTIVQLRADLPSQAGLAPYLVTLRASGPYRYYLATSVEPDASAQTRRQAALIHGTFVPEGDR